MTDKQMEEKKKEFMKMAENGIQASLGVERYGVSIIFEDGYIDLLWQWISKLVEEVEREALEKIVGLSIEMEGSFNNAMFNSGFGTALNEIYYRLSDGKFLDEVLEEKDKGTN